MTSSQLNFRAKERRRACPSPFTHMDHSKIVQGPFLLTKDAARGVETWGWFEDGDERMHAQTRQYIPDGFLDQNNEQEAAWSKSDTRKSHYQRFASIPSQLRQNWCEEFGVTHLFEDPDVAAKVKQRLNSNEYRKLRTGGGKL
jgi:hypothetical protein